MQRISLTKYFLQELSFVLHNVHEFHSNSLSFSFLGFLNTIFGAIRYTSEIGCEDVTRNQYLV
jgi:hypothetical protein